MLRRLSRRLRVLPRAALIALPLAAFLAAPAAEAMEDACRIAMRDRLNLMIGFYRIELSASHLVGQMEAARKNPTRTKQLEGAEDGLNDLKGRLKTRASEVLRDNTAGGRCGADAAQVGEIHAAIELYTQTVEARWQFTQRRLAELKRLPAGQALPGDAAELDLWMQEPLTRYNVWRAFAGASSPQGKTAAALYVVGMLTRFEWDTAVAFNDAIRGRKSPAKALAAASEDVATLRRTWPRATENSDQQLWATLTAITRALPDPDRVAIPETPPSQGWNAWIADWIRPYGDAFTHAAPGLLKSLEDLGLD